MPSKPKVSVIMPVYNGERFLRPAIDSALAQTLTDWELLVVDDGSKDSTPQILEEYTDPRIRKIRKQNGGEASARNMGLDHAAGEYVAFLDADDLYLPNALADLSAFLDGHPAFDAAFADGHLCDEHDRQLTRLSEHRPGLYTGDILEPLVLTASVITVPVCTMVRRAAIENHQIRFDPSFVIGPDWDFWIQMARVARFGYLDRITCQYRVHLTNITRTSGAARRREDLIRGREKVMRSDWFADLSEETRRKFFYNLVVELASGEPERQTAFFNEPSFLALPAGGRAALARQAGMDILQRGGSREQAAGCFAAALRWQPEDRRARLLLGALRMGRRPAQIIIYAWQTVHRAVTAARTAGQWKPKPVPASLGPVKNEGGR